jgi:hypothetical protein
LVSGDQPTVQSIVGCLGAGKKEYLRLKLNISKEDELLFLIDTGFEVSLVKGKKLIGSTRCDPSKRVKVKSLEGSEIETFRIVKAEVEVGNNFVPFEFQLVNKQVDILCDGIIGRDFFLHTKAQICYDSQNVKVGRNALRMVNAVTLRSKSENVKSRKAQLKGKKRLLHRLERKVGVLISQTLQG